MTQPQNPSNPKRTRGAQPGNQNARTHGLYSLKLPPALESANLNDVNPALNLSEEIVLIRYSLRWLFSPLPPDASFEQLCAYIRAAYLATTSINRLVRTQSAINLASDPEMEEFDKALDIVMAQIQAGHGVVGTAGLTPPPTSDKTPLS